MKSRAHILLSSLPNLPQLASGTHFLLGEQVDLSSYQPK